MDKSDQGKRLGFFSRKGGPAIIKAIDVIELPLISDPAGLPAECQAGGEEEKKQAEDAEEEAKPKNRVIALPVSVCESRGSQS